jgi:HEAT repeat protein
MATDLRLSVAEVLEGLQDKSTDNQGVRRAAARVLALYADDPRVPDALVELLRDTSDGSVHAQAASALGRLGKRAPIAPLVEAMLHDPAFGIRAEAARTLVALGDRPPVKAFVQALEDPSPGCVRRRHAV